ncbi:MAG: glycerol-3-phosphate dehydrogenase [Chloroflexota bacterium]|jgi:glycerol-3-phosphate dehydrogenase (NAD(P)+)|nr:glycerol-3-phosphate dehydrogenase [Chloroflexota bacterium]
MDRHATRAVIGAGQWGTTLALHLARRGPVTLLARDEEQARQLIGERRNSRYLPDIALPVEIEISADPAAVASASELVIFAVPSRAMRASAERTRGQIHGDAVLLSVAKGLEQGSLDRMTQVIADVLPEAQGRIGALSGPNLAQEIARGLPASAVIAAEDEEVSLRASDIVGTRSFRVYRNRDVTGVELCGALKNVIAIAAGAAEQLGFGDNGKAGLITRGLAEMTRLGMAAGAHPLTFAGLAGLGDVIATCYSALSRNHALGVELAKGRKWAEIEGTLAGVAEGAYTVEAALALARQHGVEMPIAQEVHNAIYEGKSVQRCLIDLLSREQKDELADVEQWARRAYGERARSGA